MRFLVAWSIVAALATLDATTVLAEDKKLLPQTSPAWLANIPTPTGNAVITQYPKDDTIKAQPLPGPYKIDLNKYPKQLQMPPTDSPEVQDVIKQLDWSKIPKAQQRVIKTWAVDTSGYPKTDPDCWWSASTCKRPKLSYLPDDIYTCPQAGHWGLNYDDGPLKVYSFDQSEKAWEEPRFYNFLIEHSKQKATMFFIGSNVVAFPEAAQRALNDGHTICAHTWSHKQMTSLSNEQIVAELYWTHRAIKEVLGVTPKCWRPPYGDVDDRVRAIAWQMGMRTVIWDQDSNDWNLYGTPARGSVSPQEIDGHFTDWIAKRVNNMDNEHGHITLQHENSNSTISMAERWLPKLQQAFEVMPIHKCINDPYPYWEKSWAYPTLENANPPLNQVDPSSPQTPKTTSDAPSGRHAGGSSTITQSFAGSVIRSHALGLTAYVCALGVLVLAL
ncbi:hypothetical protein BDB00DRAFT_948947 [Zychaea mexicana]|uniref:uncharacterized protein n=1 Tax=Zychaea mexicana TaxID=64656 RepID=UPI0022FEF332|nr:uncharacterized protein BDB00DRAFT_948947 [Zychaea mexicana]KAI9499204.1 hypothetical protein BDB00DRAFT_948947 [Zychaea mexicana]